jgi:hypothetical protein
MVRRTLALDESVALADDAADALALALCHLFRSKFPQPTARRANSLTRRHPLNAATGFARPIGFERQ